MGVQVRLKPTHACDLSTQMGLAASFIVMAAGDWGHDVGLEHGCSRSVVQAGCRDLRPDVVTGSGFASGLARRGWSGCCVQAPRNRWRTPVPFRSQSCCCCCSEHRGMQHVCSHAVSGAGSGHLWPDVMGSGFLSGLAPAGWWGVCLRAPWSDCRYLVLLQKYGCECFCHHWSRC